MHGVFFFFFEVQFIDLRTKLRGLSKSRNIATIVVKIFGCQNHELFSCMSDQFNYFLNEFLLDLKRITLLSKPLFSFVPNTISLHFSYKFIFNSIS